MILVGEIYVVGIAQVPTVIGGRRLAIGDRFRAEVREGGNVYYADGLVVDIDETAATVDFDSRLPD